MRLLSYTLILCAGAALLGPAPAPAHAEAVRLKSGKLLDVDAVKVLEDRINVTMHRDGGTARVDLRFALLDPRGLLELFDRHTDRKDAAQRLRSARVALGSDLRGEAAKRFREAAVLDAALAPERDAGLATLRMREATEGLGELEQRLRQGDDPHTAMALSAALLEGPQAAGLTTAQQVRARSLGALARRLFKRDQARAAKQLLADAPQPAAKPAAGAAPKAAAKGGAVAELFARVRGHEAKATTARDAAADPKISPRTALRHLEAAATALQHARRLVREAPASLVAEMTPHAERLRGLLVATYLDLADLYRGAGRFSEARARVRAALILDPGNEQAWAQRKLIESDLRRDPVFDDGALGGPAVQTYYYSPSPYYGSYLRRSGLGYPRSLYRSSRYGGLHGGFHLDLGSSHLHFGLGRGHSHGHAHGTRRVTGTRR